jgi:hypothetical protein
MAVEGHESARKGAADEIHDRWIARRLRPTVIEDQLDDWVEKQCGKCRFWFPLAGELGSDWGVCSNAGSSHDQRAVFEHDGCDHFQGAGLWIVPEDM